ncbi:phosphopantetheine-binding protein [Actinophytocola sp.]|uniref:phosphopantetheine-binding protein n=1 Tax=Actinophytocola sp. TaxID=1872138 RepID=UPI00389B0228
MALAELAGQAWRDVLRCPGPSCLDNFFELGGHSVAGARVMSRLQPHVATRLSLRVLFDHPVFGEFVAAITRLAEQPA